GVQQQQQRLALDVQDAEGDQVRQALGGLVVHDHVGDGGQPGPQPVGQAQQPPVLGGGLDQAGVQRRGHGGDAGQVLHAGAAASRTGCTGPTSWLACCRQTSRVSSRTAAASSSGSTRPPRSTPTSLTSKPCAASALAGLSTAVCSTAPTTRWRRRRAALAMPP